MKHFVARLTVLITAAVVGAQTQPATQPRLTPEMQAALLVDYLNAENGKLLKSPDWLERSLALVSLAKVPGSKATDQILGAMKQDDAPFVRLMAWQVMLSRSRHLSNADYQHWMDVTAAMANKDFFRGGTRIGLLRALAINPPGKSAKVMFARIFSQTSALEPRDIPVLDALAETLAAWRSPELVEFLFNRLGVLNDAYRAEYVLQRAGVRSPWAAGRQDLGSAAMWKLAIDNYADAIRQGADAWKPMTAATPEAWRTLAPQYVPAADLAAPIDANSPQWRRETELGRVDAKPLDVVFVVDATGSMQHVIDTLKRDIGQIKGAMELISGRPRIGLTFYRDHGDMFLTRSLKLTDRLNTLDAFLSTMEAKGGVDRPEAVAEALSDAIQANPWSWKRQARKAIILLTDAPPHPATQGQCVKIAKSCRDNGVQLHVAKVRDSQEDQSDLSALDALAEASGTEPLWLPGADVNPPRYPTPPRWDRQTAKAVQVAFAPPADDAARLILRRLIVSAINPKYADRVDPLVDLLLAVTAVSEPEKRLPFGVPTPAGQGVDMAKPRDRQAR